MPGLAAHCYPRELMPSLPQTDCTVSSGRCQASDFSKLLRRFQCTAEAENQHAGASDANGLGRDWATGFLKFPRKCVRAETFPVEALSNGAELG